MSQDLSEDHDPYVHYLEATESERDFYLSAPGGENEPPVLALLEAVRVGCASCVLSLVDVVMAEASLVRRLGSFVVVLAGAFVAKKDVDEARVAFVSNVVAAVCGDELLRMFDPEVGPDDTDDRLILLDKQERIEVVWRAIAALRLLNSEFRR